MEPDRELRQQSLREIAVGRREKDRLAGRPQLSDDEYLSQAQAEGMVAGIRTAAGAKTALFGTPKLDGQRGKAKQVLVEVARERPNSVAAVALEVVGPFADLVAEFGAGKIGEHYANEVRYLLELPATRENLRRLADIETKFWRSKDGSLPGAMVSADSRFEMLDAVLREKEKAANATHADTARRIVSSPRPREPEAASSERHTSIWATDRLAAAAAPVRENPWHMFANPTIEEIEEAERAQRRDALAKQGFVEREIRGVNVIIPPRLSRFAVNGIVGGIVHARHEEAREEAERQRLLYAAEAANAERDAAFENQKESELK